MSSTYLLIKEIDNNYNIWPPFKKLINSVEYSSQMDVFGIVVTIVTLSIVVVLWYYLNQKSIVKLFKHPTRTTHNNTNLKDQYYRHSILIIIQIISMSMISLYSIMWINEKFVINGFTLLDWLTDTSWSIDSLRKGAYFSVLVSGFISSFFVNVLFKNRAKNKSSISTDIRYIIFWIVSFVGIFVGLYAIFNFINNIRCFSSVNEWYAQEKILGTVSIRIAAILLSYRLFSYYFGSLMKLPLIVFFFTGLLPTKGWGTGISNISHGDGSSVFFAQLGFYIINLFTLELSIIYNKQNTLTSILSFLILFIIDDWVIIYDYSYRLKSILKAHRIRLYVFNFFLLITSTILLWEMNNYIFMICYIMISILLLKIYLENKIKLQIIHN